MHRLKLIGPTTANILPQIALKVKKEPNICANTNWEQKTHRSLKKKLGKLDNNVYIFFVTLPMVIYCNVFFFFPDIFIMLYPVTDLLSVCVSDRAKYTYSANCPTNEVFNIHRVAGIFLQTVM